MATTHPFHVQGPDPIEGAPENLTSVTASLVPAERPDLLIRWRYTLRDETHLEPCGVSIEPNPDLPPTEWGPIGATVIRDLPLAKLERAARSGLTFALRAPDGAPLPWSGAVAESDIPAVAQEMVRERHPEVDPGAGAGAVRRWKRLLRLAEVTLEQQAAQARGEKSPANAIAEARGVAPATVRSWLHQAKQEGFEVLPFAEFSAVAPGPETTEEP